MLAFTVQSSITALPNAPNLLHNSLVDMSSLAPRETPSPVQGRNALDPAVQLRDIRIFET